MNNLEEKYDIEEYDYHQLCFLLKLSPESLLYTSDIFNDMGGFDNQKIKLIINAFSLIINLDYFPSLTTNT